MNDTGHAVRLALTGQLPFLLVISAALAYPVSRFLLWMYTRAVLRSMRARTTPRDAGHDAGHAARGGLDAETPTLDAALAIDVLTRSSPFALAGDADVLYRQTITRPWRLAAVHAAAGVAYAAVMTSAFLVSAGIPFLPMQFAMILWTNLWPAVLATASIAATTRRPRVRLLAAYAGVFAIIGFVSLARSPDLSVWQLVVFWSLTNMPPSLLLLAFLSRAVRGVGPLVLTFIAVGVLGSLLLIAVAGATDAGLHAMVTIEMTTGLPAIGVWAAIVVAGFLAFGLAGWLALRVIGRRYQQRRVSDQSLTLAATWLLFAIAGSVGLVFEGLAWALTAVVAFGAYLSVTRVGFRLLRNRESPLPSPQLLLLRVFSLGRHSERLYDLFVTAWRHVGSVSLIAGPDLATTTIEPHEFLDFVSGTLSRRFIDSSAALEQRLSEVERGRDPDGRFRVADFFCHADTWQTVLRRLVATSDAVLMDLRGFTPQHAGCIFEVHALVSAMQLERVVFVIDRSTDRPFLERTLRTAWSRTLAPRAGVIAPGRATLFDLAQVDGGTVRALQRAVCAAARAGGGTVVP